jgi:hypothetical protein
MGLPGGLPAPPNIQGLVSSLTEGPAFIQSLVNAADELSRAARVLSASGDGSILPFPTVQPEDLVLISYPNMNGIRAMPAGEVVVDLAEGLVARVDKSGGERLSGSLAVGGYSVAKSGLLWADSDLVVTFLNNGVGSGALRLTQGAYMPFGPMPINALSLLSSAPYNLSMLFSTLDRTPLDLMAQDMAQERYADPTSINDFTPIDFTPTGGQYLANDYRLPVIRTRNIGTKVFMVNNLDAANDVDVNIQFQEADKDESENWIDDPNTTGSTTTVAAGDQAIFESGINTRAVRMRLRSTVADSPAAVRVSYRGISQLR